ncbi:MAG: DUF5058 family protein [Christensenellaceae bacterium]|nr:DUF5058 family protein [Christensenellaceae bacterium]
MGSANFDVNSPFLFIAVGFIILFVIAQSIFFLVKAWRRAKEKGMDTSVLKKTVISSAVFTVAPAVAILIGVISLSKKLGVALPWLRLSVIGSLTYELTAAEAAASGVGANLGESSVPLTAEQFGAIVWVMAIGIIIGLIIVPIFSKKILGGMSKLKTKDEKWADLFSTALFLGMISAFLGVIFADITSGITGWIPVFVMIVSAVLMLIVGLLRKVTKAKWIEDYALPIAMVGGMAFAIPITNLVNSIGGVL